MDTITTYRMIVKTNGQVETTNHLTADQLDKARETARLSAPLGSTRTINVIQNR